MVKSALGGSGQRGARLQPPSKFSVLCADGVIFMQLSTTTSEVSIPVPSQPWMKTDFEDSSTLLHSTPNNLHIFLTNSARALGLGPTENNKRGWVVDLETQVKEEFVGAKGV